MKNRLLMAWTLSCAGALPAQQEVGQEVVDGERFATAVAHYRAGRFEEARVLFAAEAASRGEAAPAELLSNHALAALRVERPAEAAAAARRLAAMPDTSERAWGEFLLGGASWQQGQRALAAARLRDAEPMAWDLAVRGFEEAFAHWRSASELRPDWQEAVRNAERALLALEAARAARSEAAAKQAGEHREPEPPPPGPGELEEQAPQMTRQALPPAEVAKLLQRLREKEQQKLRSRRQAQRASAVAGERDW
jgi:hypothetical protein